MNDKTSLTLLLGLLNDRSVPTVDDAVSALTDEESADFHKLREELFAVRETLKCFSSGNFEKDVTLRGAVGGYLKTLQANLRHLTWQVEQVAAGDFSQRVDFMGDFSSAFNSMSAQLEHLRTESEEREVRERLLRLGILDTSPVCFATLVEGVVRVAAPFMKDFLGIDVDDRLSDYFASRDYGMQLEEELKRESTIHWRPVTMRSKNGKMKEMLADFFPVDYYGEQGTMVWLVDVTEIRKTEAELRQSRDTAEKLAKIKSEFLATMSHEIRTPMNAILGMMHLVRQTPLSEQQSQYIETTENSAKLLLRIINDILDFSKIEAGRMTMESHVFSLRTVVDEVVSVITESVEKNRVRLIWDIAPEIPEELVGDPIRLKQVLLNLLSNAAKFTREGSVHLQVEFDRRKRDGHSLLFTVRDTGIGMSEDDIDRIFAPFTQVDGSLSRKHGGTGLGLTICKNIVEMMNGNIWCRSRVNEGSTFFFTARFDLPPSVPETDVNEPRFHGESGERQDDVVIPEPLQGMSVLLAEDNKINQIVAVEMLKLKGFSVDVVPNGREAVKAIRHKSYGIVLMDVQMPEMDGLQAARLIRQDARYADLPILALTANALPEDREHCLEAGMNDHIPKPIEPSVLYRSIIQWGNHFEK